MLARLSEMKATFFLRSEAYSTAATSLASFEIDEKGLAYNATT